MRSRVAMSVSSESSEIRADSGVLGLTQPTFVKPKRLHSIYAKFLFLEFLAVAITAYLSSVAYQYAALDLRPDIHEYVPAALFIAVLVSVISVGFRHFVALQRTP